MADILTTMEEVNSFLESNKKAILQCKTHSCSVCLSVDAKMEKDKDVYKGWAMGHVYVDDLSLFRGEHSVYTVPTVLMFLEGKEIYRTSRFVEFDRLAYFVDAVG